MPRRARVGSREQGDADVHIRRRFQHGRPQPRRARESGAFPGGRGRRPPPPASSTHPDTRAASSSGSPTPSALVGRGDVAERALGPDLARGPGPDHEAQGGGRPAGAAARRVRHVPARNEDDSIDVFTGGRKLRVNVSPSVDLDELQRGQEVMLNEALNVVAAFDFEKVGEVVMFKELLEDGDRALVIANADEERVVRLAEPLLRDTIGPATRCCSTHAPATSTRRCRSRRSRSSSSRRSRTSTTRDRRADQPDRADPRRRRAALPAP